MSHNDRYNPDLDDIDLGELDILFEDKHKEERIKMIKESIKLFPNPTEPMQLDIDV